MPLRSRHFSVEKAFDDFPISTAWELLANTDHLNRTIGLPAITFDQVTVSEEDFYRAASAKALGIQTVRWKEYPFEWIRDRHYAVLRVFENGPFTRFYGGIEFTPAMEIQGRAAAFNRENQIEPPIIIKVGIHHGAAIAVNSNDRLDY
ncbi:MAG: hypothetical protein O7E52_24930, partial [Candidatus Poribacteria bacterium]|nr:hypothetical protein [Candidatus Poribacteria bacterium]